MSKINKTHLIIPDTQVKPGVDTKHLTWAGKYIVDERPDVIVHLGDHWDMPSLSYFDKGQLAMEGRRVLADIDAGNAGMHKLLQPLKQLQAKQRKWKEKIYKPRLVFIFGNHEHRIIREAEGNPSLDGFLNFDRLHLREWETVPFRDWIEIDGIHYSHFFYNPFTGKPYGGMIDTRIKNVGFSFTQGHVQGFRYGQRELNNGSLVNGLVAGSFYLHDEDYKGPQANKHWRGIVMKHCVRDGEYDIEQISIERLEELYAGG